MSARRPWGALAFLLLPFAAASGRAQDAREPQSGWTLEAFGLKNKAADFEIRLSGYLQADFREFPGWQVGDGRDSSLRAPTAEWRRARIGLKGEWQRLSFEADVDPAFDKGDMLKTAQLNLELARALVLGGGHIKVPVSVEWLGSPAKTDLIERATGTNALAPGRDWGGQGQGELGHWLEWRAGYFAGDGDSSSRRSLATVAGRLVLKPTRWLDLGGSYSQAEVVEPPTGAEAVGESPKGVEGTSGSGYVFYPGVHVNGRRQRWSADARLESGPIALWGELLEAREERLGQGPTGEDLPTSYGRGWSATATWLVTGDRKTRTIKPRRPLFGGPGAIELAARIEAVWFDDVENQGFESAGSRARNIRPAGIHTFTAGLSWWPTSFLRFQGNALIERYTDALRAPEPGRAGDYLTLVGRLQVHLP